MKRCIISIALVLLVMGMMNGAQVRWITPSGTNDWFVATNWSSGTIPQDGDDVLITNNNVGVLLTNSTAYLSSLTISNKATLIFSNWNSALNATNVYIAHSNSLFTLPAAFTDAPGFSNNIYIVCSNIYIKGTIDAYAKGYTSNSGPSKAVNVNVGPYIDGTGPAGPGHGGLGAYANGELNSNFYGYPYGEHTAPITPGSGGLQLNSYGGGAIRIQATGNVSLDGGIINADGSSGAGGSIYITCNTITGTNGLITARGRGGYNLAYQPAGGRIAVIYDTNAQALAGVPGIIFNAAGGYDTLYGAYPHYSRSFSILNGRMRRGEPGTLYFPDNLFLTEFMPHSGKWMSAVPLTNWSPNNLILSNAYLKFPYDGFTLSVSNNITIIGKPGWGGWGAGNQETYLELSNGVISCGGDLLISNANIMLVRGAYTNGRPVIDVKGNLIMTNGSRIFFYSGPTNDGKDYGSYIGVSNTLAISSNAALCLASHPTNGGSPLIRVGTLYLAPSVDTNSGTATNYSAWIRADNGGYAGYWVPSMGGGAKTNGHGPGKGNSTIGGGYGGRGGGPTSSVYGLTYGDSNAPVHPGSSGGTYMYYGPTLGGGGVVRIEAERVELNGLISANGYPAWNGESGGSAGGSIFIKVRYLYGIGGALLAKGGNGYLSTGCGGGGRICVLRLHDYSSGIITDVSPGNPASAAPGEAGTVVFGVLPWPKGTVISIK